MAVVLLIVSIGLYIYVQQDDGDAGY